MHTLQDTVTDACVTKQTLDSNRKYFSFLRLIYLEVDGMAPVKAKVGKWSVRESFALPYNLFKLRYHS